MTDLMEWAAAFTVPPSSDAMPREVKFSAATLPAPAEARIDVVRALPSWRRPSSGAIAIDVAEIIAEHEGYRALGLVLLSYALSEQEKELRIHLPGPPGAPVRQIVLWPDTPTQMEVESGIRLRVHEVRYRPRAIRLIEDDDARLPIQEEEAGHFSHPREHLPFCALGPPTSVRGGPPRLPGDPWCLHVAGTGASMAWLGTLFLDLSLSDSNARHSYRYNTLPAEELARGSAELSLYVGEPAALYAPVDAEGASPADGDG